MMTLSVYLFTPFSYAGAFLTCAADDFASLVNLATNKHSFLSFNCIRQFNPFLRDFPSFEQTFSKPSALDFLYVEKYFLMESFVGKTHL